MGNKAFGYETTQENGIGNLEYREEGYIIPVVKPIAFGGTMYSVLHPMCKGTEVVSFYETRNGIYYTSDHDIVYFKKAQL